MRRFHQGGIGEGVEILVPPGTTIQEEVDITIKDEDGQDVIIGQEYVDVGMLSMENPTLIVARGGRGGEGSGVLRKANVAGKNRRRSSPQRYVFESSAG